MPHGDLIALIGSPRSGTTWLQRLLAADPRIVSPQETDIFTRFVAPLDAAWQHTLRGGPEAWAERRYKGLPSVLTEAEFVAAVRAFVQTTIDATYALKPGAHTLVEKSPSHSLHTDLIERYGPPTKFVHLIRDGRDVAASLVAASSGWGSAWAPATIRGASRVWREHVEHAREASERGPYLEVRYEALRGPTGAEELQKVFAFCDCDLERAAATELLETHARSRPETPTSLVFGGEAAGRVGVGSEPEGFTSTGPTRGWPSWSTEERAAFAAEAGALLIELGYAGDDAWVGTARARRSAGRRYARRRFTGRALRRVGTSLRGAGARLVDRD